MNLQFASSSAPKTVSTMLLAVIFCLFTLTSASAAEPEEILDFHAEEYAGRIDPMIRISGDGSKMVYIVKERGFDTSLEGWLKALPEGWSASDAARVYLYDLSTKERTLLYEGKFGTASVDNQTVLQSLEGGFSVDINRSASRVVLAYSSISMSGERDRLSNSLKITAIDTRSLAVTEVAALSQPGYSPKAVQLKMSEDGSRAIFAIEPPTDKTANVYGVEWLESAYKAQLMSVKLQAQSQPVELSDPDWDAYGAENALTSMIGSAYSGFFDVSANGNSVVFHNLGTGLLYTVTADGQQRRSIAQLPPGRAGYVAISADGNLVAFADRTNFEETVLYHIPFAGGDKTEITRSNTYYAGNLKFNATGSHLLYQDVVADPGGSFGFAGTTRIVSLDGSSSISAGKDIADASDNLNLVLSTVSGWRGALELYRTAVAELQPGTPSDIYMGAFNGTAPDPALPIELNNIGLLATDNWRIYSCIRVLQNGAPALYNGMDSLDLTLEITSLDTGAIRVLSARPFNANKEHNAAGFLPDCSGSFDLVSNLYQDVIKFDSSVYQTVFELVNGDTLELVLKSAELVQ